MNEHVLVQIVRSNKSKLLKQMTTIFYDNQLKS